MLERMNIYRPSKITAIVRGRLREGVSGWRRPGAEGRVNPFANSWASDRFAMPRSIWLGSKDLR